MSITKTLTSMTLGRAMQLGHVKFEELDRPVIEFMPAINRKTIQPGVETITLRDALMMKSGLLKPSCILDTGLVPVEVVRLSC